MKFIIKKSKNKEIYFILVARNGKTVMQSETYKRKASCTKAIASLQKGISNAKIIEQIK